MPNVMVSSPRLFFVSCRRNHFRIEPASMTKFESAEAILAAVGKPLGESQMAHDYAGTASLTSPTRL